MRRWLSLFFILIASVCFANNDRYTFASATQQQIFEQLLPKLRCLVCQNQSLADSNAPLAEDLRQQIVQMIQQGATQQQVINYLVQRYGEFVLYQPAWSNKTYLLWLTPFLLLILGMIILCYLMRRRKPQQDI